MTSRELITSIAEHHRIDISELIREGTWERGRKTRSPEAAIAKAEIAHELRVQLKLSYPAIARALRLRCHSSARYLCLTHARRERRREANRANAGKLWENAPPGMRLMFALRAQAGREYRVTCECGICPKCRNRAYKIAWRKRKLTADQLAGCERYRGIL